MQFSNFQILFSPLILLLLGTFFRVQGQDRIISFEKNIEAILDNDGYSMVASDQLFEQAIQNVLASDLSANDKFDLKYFLRQLSYADELPNLPALNYKMLLQLEHFFPKDTLNDLLGKWAIKNFQEKNRRLFSYYAGGEIKDVKVNLNHQTIQELLAYELTDNISVAEIGAGAGDFALLLKLFHPTIDLTITEITTDQVGQILTHLLIFPSEEREAIKVVQGKINSTQIEGQNLDVIIIRNTFHHFMQPDAMLQSIRKSLRPGGRLMLLEQFKGDVPNTIEFCAHLKERVVIEELLAQNGWILDRIVYLDKQRKYLLEYK